MFAVFPAIEIIKNDKKILHSHGGASYGGFVYPKQLNIRDAFLLVEQLIEYAKKHNFDAIQLTLPPLIYSHHISTMEGGMVSTDNYELYLILFRRGFPSHYLFSIINIHLFLYI